MISLSALLEVSNSSLTLCLLLERGWKVEEPGALLKLTASALLILLGPEGEKQSQHFLLKRDEYVYTM